MKKCYDKGELYISVIRIIIVAIPLWLPVMFFAADKFYFTPTRNIETNWEIEIPSDFNQIYHVTSDNIYARADGYTVYETPEEISSFLQGFSSTKQSSAESFVKKIIIRLSVSENYQPPFDESYYYLERYAQGDRLIVIYSPKSDRCFVIESFSWDSI